MVQFQNRNANGAIVAQFHHLLKQSAEASAIPVGRQAHDFVLVGIEVESEMECDQRIEDPDGVVGTYGMEFLKLAIVKIVDADTLGFSHGVVHNDEALIPSGGVGRAGSVR